MATTIPMHFLTLAKQIPDEYVRHMFLRTLLEQLGFLGISAVKADIAQENANTAIANHELSGIDLYSELQNSEADAEEDALFRTEAGFTSAPDLPKVQIFGAYKRLYSLMTSTDMFRKYPPRTLAVMIDGIASMNETNEDVQKVAAETKAFLSKQEEGVLNPEVVGKAYERRTAQIKTRRVERTDTVKERVTDEVANANSEKLEFTWAALPTWAKWRIIHALWNFCSRSAGSLKADEEDAKKNNNLNSTAGASHDAVVQVAAELYQDMMDALDDKDLRNDLQIAYKNKKLFDTHLITNVQQPQHELVTE